MKKYLIILLVIILVSCKNNTRETVNNKNHNNYTVSVTDSLFIYIQRNYKRICVLQQFVINFNLRCKI